MGIIAILILLPSLIVMIVHSNDEVALKEKFCRTSYKDLKDYEKCNKDFYKMIEPIKFKEGKQ